MNDNEERLREQIENYLDHAYAPLIGVVPYQRRQELRREMKHHLESLIQEHLDQETEPEKAVEKAIRQFGHPKKIGKDWAWEWRQPASEGPIPLSRILRTPFICFGGATLLLFILIHPLLNLNRIINTLGLEEAGAVLMFGVPLAAGILTGAKDPGRPYYGTFLCLAGIILAGGLQSLFNLNFRPSIFGASNLPELVLVQSIFWLPLGYLGIALGQAYRWASRQSLRPFHPASS